MMVPRSIRDEIKAWLWAKADALGWSALSDIERATFYEQWTRGPEVGGRLGYFMDPRQVRVYIKDSLIKPYERSRLSLRERDVWPLLSLPSPGSAVEHYTKPHGRRLCDGKIVCWGRSRDWKLILMAVFERAHEHAGFKPFGAVLLESGTTTDEQRRALIRDAAKHLGIQRIGWLG